jgi:hypothetical protein
MTTTRKTSTIWQCDIEDIASQVDRMFKEAADRTQPVRTNVVTGARWVPGHDPIKPQKRAAGRALMAREWFAVTAPPDAPPLPLSYGELQNLKAGGLPHLVAWYAQSLQARNYEFWRHPSFEDYARGVLASTYAPDFIRSNQHLRQRFAPTPLNGLGPGLVWHPVRPNSCKYAPFSPGQRDGISVQNAPEDKPQYGHDPSNVERGGGVPGDREFRDSFSPF